MFIEMNTRIQVEHTITEELTGIDLIKLQIKLAAGDRLDIKQEDVKPRGHIIEFRINAEDPENNFLPSPGTIDFLHLPAGFGVRIDTHAYQGYKIPPYYDSMIGKMIVKDKTRKSAIEIAKRCLDEFMVEPLKTTIPLYKKILTDENFVKGNYNTGFLTRYTGPEVGNE